MQPAVDQKKVQSLTSTIYIDQINFFEKIIFNFQNFEKFKILKNSKEASSHDRIKMTNFWLEYYQTNFRLTNIILRHPQYKCKFRRISLFVPSQNKSIFENMKLKITSLAGGWNGRWVGGC